MSNSKAVALYFEIADAMDLLDNVTADYGSEDSLGQAELALTRAREILVDQGMLRIFAEAPAMVEALRRILQWIDAGCDPSRKSLENARAILSRIDGANPPLSAYAETVTDAEYREIANGRASWPLKGASGDGAGDTLPDAPVPAPTGEVVTVRADHLAALVEAAGKYADDLETGLEDGTYEDRADLDAVKAAIAAVQGEA